MPITSAKVTHGRLPDRLVPTPVPEYLLHLEWDDLAQLLQRYCSASREAALDLLLSQSITLSVAPCTPCQLRSATARFRVFLSRPAPNFPDT
jgi:hypothetical protein